MNLYLLTQDINNKYDTYDGMVICAENHDEAVELSYRGDIEHYKNGHQEWVRYDYKHLIQVTLIGVASSETQKGIVLASFNAG